MLPNRAVGGGREPQRRRLCCSVTQQRATLAVSLLRLRSWEFLFLNQQTAPLIPIAMLQELPALSGYAEEQDTLGKEVLQISGAA